MGIVEPEVDIYVGGAEGWVPVETDVRQGVADSGGGITITRGRSAEGTVAAPGSAQLVLADPSGAYAGGNPRSPYFGLLGRNTPIRIGLPLVGDDFGRTVASSWGATPSGQTWDATGGAPADFAVASGVATITHPTIDVLRWTDLDVQLVDGEQVADIATSATTTGASLVTGHMARYNPVTGECYWLRLEFNPTGTLSVKISKFVASAGLVGIAELIDVPDLTYAAGQPLRMRSSVVDGRLSIRVWDPDDPEPATWTLTATDTDITDAGRVGFMTWVVGGNTNSPALTVSVDNYRVLDRRAVMEVPSWPPRWTVNGSDVWTTITAQGILQRLSGLRRPLRSALRRAIPRTSPVAYWPLEDPAGSTTAAADESTAAEPMRLFGYSRFTIPGSGGQPQAPAGLPVFASGSGVPGSAPVLDLSQGGTLWAPVPQVTGATGWQVEWVMRCPRGETAGQVALRWITNDNYTDHPEAGRQIAWDVDITTSGITIFYSMVESPFTTFGSGFANFTPFDGLSHHYRVNAEVIGGEIWADLYIDGVLSANIVSLSETEAGTTGQVQSVIVNPLEVAAGASSMPTVGHIAVWASLPDTSDVVSAATGHAGETAGARLARLAAEQGVPMAVVGDPDDTEPMGPQGIRTLYDLLTECAAIDGGVLYEQRETLGLAYRTRASLYNQDPLLEVDYTHLAPGLEPEPDTFAVTNDVTVTGNTGTYRAVLESGRLSVQDPPDGIGEVPEDVPVNEAYPHQLPHLASWLRGLGTWDEARYPQVPVMLHGAPFRSDVELTARAAALDSGRVLAIDGLPDWLPPGPIRLMVQGGTERIPTSAERTLSWVMEPAEPYTVGVVEDEVLGRADTDGMELATDFTAGTDTSMSVTVTAGPAPILTSTHASMFPFDIRCGAVVLEVTGISGGGPYTFTVTQAPVNGITGLLAAGASLSLAHPWRAAL
jgi:hypothetical protein